LTRPTIAYPSDVRWLRATEGGWAPSDLLDINKARGDVMLKHVQQRLSELLPNVEVKHYRKLTPARLATDDLPTDAAGVRLRDRRPR
jgi:hypothetical protein